MTEHSEETQNTILAPDNRREGRNLIVVFLGFLLLGAALGLLLFGGDLFDSILGDDQEEGSTSGATILEQAGALPAVEVGQDSFTTGSGDGDYLEVGDKAFDFELADFEGNPVKLSDFEGQPVIVNFWATWCAPCRLEMPELQDAFEKYEDQGLVILALDQDEPVERGREFFYDEMGLTFTPLVDEGSAVSTAYSSFSVLPTTYFLDREGLVAAIHRGPLTGGQIEGYLELAGVTEG